MPPFPMAGGIFAFHWCILSKMASATAAGMPGTAIRSSSVAWRIAATVLKWRSSAVRRFFPRPLIPSRIDPGPSGYAASCETKSRIGGPRHEPHQKMKPGIVLAWNKHPGLVAQVVRRVRKIRPFILAQSGRFRRPAVRRHEQSFGVWETDEPGIATTLDLASATREFEAPGCQEPPWLP